VQSNLEPDLERPPQGYFVVVPPGDREASIDLTRILAVLRRYWKLPLTAFVAGAVIAAAVALQMPNVYRSEVLLSPVTQSGAGPPSALRNQLGGLAALAGIDLASGGGRKEEFFATLASPGFARDFIAANNLMPVLFEERWDAGSSDWHAGEEVPTVEDGVRLFTSEVRAVTEDRRTGLIRLRVDWYDPKTAAAWANGMVAMANDRLREDAVRDAEQSIEYLNKELAKTTVVELRQAIYRLIESQVNNSMLANVQREYAFRIIDSAVPADPKRKVFPKRSLITLAGAGLGGLLGVIWVLWRRRADWLA